MMTLSPATMHHPVQALIFDMDGTMIDSMPTHQKSWAVFAQRHGITMPIEELMRGTTGRTGTECMEVLFGRAFTPEEALHLVHEKEALYREMYTPVFSEVLGFKNFVTQARARGLKIGVGTAGDLSNVAFVLSHLKLSPAPDAMARGDEGLAGKPSPDIFLTAAKRLDVSPEHCIVFEDAPLGIEAALRAGMRAVGICTGHSAEQLSAAHVLTTVRHYEELTDKNSKTNFWELIHVA